MKKAWIAMFVVTALLCSPGFSQQPLEFGVTADFMGKYIWRGQILSDDPVFQPGATLTYKNFTAGFWGNMDLTSINNHSGEFTEYDYYLDYSAQLCEGIGYSVGLIYYYFPGLTDTTELYWGIGFDVPLNPAITVYYDVDEVEGAYICGSVGHTFENVFEIVQGTPTSVELGASLGWGSASYNDGYWGTDQSKLNDLALSIAFPTRFGNLTLSPSLNYVALVSYDIRSTDAFTTESDYFFAGLNLVYDF